MSEYTMTAEINISIKKGGFVLTSYSQDNIRNEEIFTSQQKLIKAIKDLIKSTQPSELEA